MQSEILDENAPFGFKVGDWIVCANEHKNWRALADVPDSASLSALAFADPDNNPPVAGQRVANCRDCGESLIVNGNQGLRFRVLRHVACTDPEAA